MTFDVMQDSMRGGFYLTLGRFASTVISAFTVFIVARLLGPELYGLYAIAMIIPSFALLFITPGINAAIVKFSASLRREGRTRRLTRLLVHGLIAEIGLALLACALCYVFSSPIASSILQRPQSSGYVQALSTMIVLQTVFDVVSSIFVGLDRTEYSALLRGTQAVAKAVLSPSLAVLGFGVAGVITGNVGSLLLSGVIGSFLLVFKTWTPLRAPSTRAELGGHRGFTADLRVLVGYGLPLYLSGFVHGLTAQYLNTLLAVFTSDVEIGNLMAAKNFGTFIRSISLPLAATLLPAFSKIEARRDEVKRFFAFAVKYVSLLVIPVVVLLLTFSGEVIDVIYGDRYAFAPVFLALHACQFLLVGLGFSVLGSLFKGLGATKLSLRTALVRGAVIVTVGPIAIWQFRVYGALVTMLGAVTLSTLYGLHLARTRFGVRVNLRTTVKIGLVATVAAVPVLLLKRLVALPHLATLLLGSGIYLVSVVSLIPVAKLMTASELDSVKRLTRRVKGLHLLAKPILDYVEVVASRLA
jgi:O-antigen/teichoic acid export membrane protein